MTKIKYGNKTPIQNNLYMKTLDFVKTLSCPVCESELDMNCLVKNFYAYCTRTAHIYEMLYDYEFKKYKTILAFNDDKKYYEINLLIEDDVKYLVVNHTDKNNKMSKHRSKQPSLNFDGLNLEQILSKINMILTFR